ncbi:FecR domain-containing protein [Aquisalimonas asiatica]|uniref:FecR family protein n=1 Tax=Aquisalimonas asiatica TaxID=406100 RepID=A0A1H8SYU6_9GAMM|nr:FecR domain-containing protein [Aquisalimonas asiatica]SEO83538.1 FecR family protein [Aquisalimonas asiatica]
MSDSPPHTSLRFEVLEQAAEWFATLRAEDATESDRARWREWLQTSSEHQRAWARVEAMEQQFRRLQGEPVEATLNAAGATRRQVLKGLAAMALGGPLLWATVRHAPLAEWTADHRTAVGEVREVQLADGTRLWLNTDTAVNIRFDHQQRTVELVSGEILVETSPDLRTPPRPLQVSTSQGTLRPAGTRFSAHDQGDAIAVRVEAGAVHLAPTREPGTSKRLEAGKQARLTDRRVESPEPLAANLGWHNGVLRANGMPLGDFLDQLGRYRPGYLGYSHEVADLTLMGVYPLDDTDRVLTALENALPITVRRTTPWWVRVDIHRT